MSAPTTAADLLELVRRSKLVDPTILETTRKSFTSYDSPGTVLTHLRRAGLLTRFQADQLAIGRWKGFTLGSYRLLEKLGSGGMGTVYLAEHQGLRKRVAVKVLSPRLARDPSARSRFASEARAAAALDHPHIVHVMDVDTDVEPPYLVMEFVDGVSLQGAVAICGTFSVEETAYCAWQVLFGLQHAYEKKLVHRDIKPANLLVDRKGIVKILDLGIARLLERDADGSQSGRSSRKIILGTADYLAPEQARDSSDVDTRADLYALGGSLYFLLCGHPPFPSGDAQEKLMKKQHEDPVPIEKLRPDVSPAFSAFLQTLMARNPAKRFPHPAAALEALQPFLTPIPDFPSRLFRGDRTTISDCGPENPNTPPMGQISSQHLPTDEMIAVSTLPASEADMHSWQESIASADTCAHAEADLVDFAPIAHSRGRDPRLYWIALIIGLSGLTTAALLFLFRRG